MSKLELIETIALAVVALVIVVYYLILAIKNGWIKKLTQTVYEAIKYAEENLKGNEKKAYVMRRVEARCSELGIPYTLIYNIVNKLIDKVIAHHNVIDHK